MDFEIETREDLKKIGHELVNGVSNKIQELQENFLKTNWGQAIDSAIDYGLKVILPEYIEDNIIDIKNTFLKEGVHEGIEKTIDTVLDKGKEIINAFTGKLESEKQAEVILENKNIIDGVANILEDVVDKSVKDGFLNDTLGDLIKDGKKIILNNAEKNIEKINKDQINKIKEIGTSIEKWKKAFENEDFKTMENEYKKIENRIDNLLPLEEIINKVRVVENLHNLIKNNNKKFSLSEDQMELAKKLF